MIHIFTFKYFPSLGFPHSCLQLLEISLFKAPGIYNMYPHYLLENYSASI